MTDEQSETVQPRSRSFLALGSVVILNGSVKKLLIVSRGSIVEGQFFDYGAFLYPEGMIDTNIAYFNHDDIVKAVHEGYRDADDELAVEILNTAHARYRHEHAAATRIPVSATSITTAPASRAIDSDPFAGVRDLGDDDE
ncbi:DUF4176 domain-containing protein [Microbacteriaceae bacterium VKM Ac-2855]|nr:DUF4176 domain-containing protein [Microbacteriaceae bacterium VKM Ac-2855]